MQLDTAKEYTNIPVILNDRLTRVDLKKGFYNGSFSLYENGKHLTDSLEFSRGTYVHQSDDGETFYYSLFVLSDDPNFALGDIKVPDANSLSTSAMALMPKVIEKQLKGEMHSDDAGYALKLMTIPACLFPFFSGDIKKAQAKVLKDIFHIQ